MGIRYPLPVRCCDISSLLLYSVDSFVRKAALRGARATDREVEKTSRKDSALLLVRGHRRRKRITGSPFVRVISAPRPFAQNTSHLILFSPSPIPPALQTPQNHLSAIPSTTAVAAMTHKDVPHVSLVLGSTQENAKDAAARFCSPNTKYPDGAHDGAIFYAV